MENMPDFEKESRAKLRWYIDNFPSPHPFFGPAMAALGKKEDEDSSRRGGSQPAIHIHDSNVANLNVGSQVGEIAAIEISGMDSKGATNANSAVVPCGMCNASGKCGDCGGSGQVSAKNKRGEPIMVACYRCSTHGGYPGRGTGKCDVCRGAGHVRL